VETQWRVAGAGVGGMQGLLMLLLRSHGEVG